MLALSDIVHAVLSRFGFCSRQSEYQYCSAHKLPLVDNLLQATYCQNTVHLVVSYQNSMLGSSISHVHLPHLQLGAAHYHSRMTRNPQP